LGNESKSVNFSEIIVDFSAVLIFLFLCLISFNGCTQDSPLSDVDLEDPSLIKPDIQINKSISSGTITFTTITWLYDKNFNSIELKSGDVKMNNIKMTLKHGLNNEPYYVIEPFDLLPFQLNSAYECKITLSDGKIYSSSVVTRVKDLYQLNIPAEQPRNEDINVSWADAANDRELVLTMVLTGRNDSSTIVDVQGFNISNPLTGNYLVSKSYFINRPEINEAQFTLEAINRGQINQSFMSSSKITSAISITRTTKFK